MNDALRVLARMIATPADRWWGSWSYTWRVIGLAVTIERALVALSPRDAVNGGESARRLLDLKFAQHEISIATLTARRLLDLKLARHEISIATLTESL